MACQSPTVGRKPCNYQASVSLFKVKAPQPEDTVIQQTGEQSVLWGVAASKSSHVPETKISSPKLGMNTSGEKKKACSICIAGLMGKINTEFSLSPLQRAKLSSGTKNIFT